MIHPWGFSLGTGALRSQETGCLSHQRAAAVQSGGEVSRKPTVLQGRLRETQKAAVQISSE